MIMTLAEVAPVADVHRAVRPLRHADAAEPRIVAQHEIRTALADVAVALALDAVDVQTVAVQIAHEDAIAIFLREIVTLIDHAAGMGVAAAGVGVLALAAARIGPVAARPVQMLRGRVDQLVGVTIIVEAVHPLVVGARNHVPEMADHAVGEKALAMLVEIEAPGIRRAVTDHLDNLARRMVTPDTAVDLRPFLLRRSGNARP